MAPTEEKRLTERNRAAACFIYNLARVNLAWAGGTPIPHNSSVASLMKFLSKPSRPAAKEYRRISYLSLLSLSLFPLWYCTHYQIKALAPPRLLSHTFLNSSEMDFG
jgi:hypothetical protein